MLFLLLWLFSLSQKVSIKSGTGPGFGPCDIPVIILSSHNKGCSYMTEKGRLRGTKRGVGGEEEDREKKNNV